MDKELKKQIKEDEFRSGLEHAWAYAKNNRAAVQTAGLAAFLAIGGVWAFSSWRGGRAAQSEAELQAALNIFDGPSDPGNNDKDTKALAAFEGVEKRFGTTPAGRRARYLGAVSRLRVGQTADGRKTLEQIAAERTDDGLEATLARLALAESYVSGGELEKGIDLYRKVMEDPSIPVARDYVLMALGSALERAGRHDEARSVFKRVMDEFPAGRAASEAAQRHESL